MLIMLMPSTVEDYDQTAQRLRLLNVLNFEFFS